MDPALDLRLRFPVDDQALSELHARAFGHPGSEAQPWQRRLQHYSLTWVGAFSGAALVGFANACWDGGSHAFVLDTAVDPNYQRQGVGRALVQALVEQARAAGCEWLHVDYEPHLAAFYRDACGFRASDAGLLHLDPVGVRPGRPRADSQRQRMVPPACGGDVVDEELGS